MSKQLIQASLNLDLAKSSFNPAQEVAGQVGKAVDSYIKYQEQQSEKAYKIAEGLQEGMVGFDLMNDQAQTYYEDQLQVVATELASARAKKDSKEVRRLLAKGKSLVEDQNKIGQIIYAHSQDKLSDTYVAGANTHVLDLLVNKKYQIIEKDEERFIKFETTETGDFNTIDGVSINDLDKYAIIKDPNIANNYLNNLNTIAKQAGAGKSYVNSPGQNSVNVTINDMLKDVDGLQNALFTRNFQLKDGNRIADLYYIKSESKLPMNEFVNKFMTPGRNDYDSEKLTEFVKQKLQDGALNHNNYYFEEKEINKNKNKNLKYGGFAYASDTGGDSTSGVKAFTNISYSDKVARRKSLLNLDTIPGAHYTYKYDENEEGGWAAYDGTEFVRNMDGAEVARIEGLMSMNDKSFSVFNQEKVQKDLDQKDLKPKTPGSVGLGLINIKGNTTKDQINKIASNLHKTFDSQFKENFNISAITKTSYGGGGMFGGGSRKTTTPNKMKITSKDGNFSKIYDIGPNATQKSVDQINKDFADYLMLIDDSYQDEDK